VRGKGGRVADGFDGGEKKGEFVREKASGGLVFRKKGKS